MLEGEWAGVVEEFFEEGAGVEGDVVCGGEDAGVAGYSAHAAGGGVVDYPSCEYVEMGVCLCVAFIVVGGGGCARHDLVAIPLVFNAHAAVIAISFGRIDIRAAHFGDWQVTGIGHAEW